MGRGNFWGKGLSVEKSKYLSTFVQQLNDFILSEFRHLLGYTLCRCVLLFLMVSFLSNVHVRSMLSPVRLSSVCLSSITLVHLFSGG